MQYITLILNLFSLIIKLMKTAEKYGEPGTGVHKKEMVVGGTKAVVDAISEESTGGQKETWVKIKEPVSELIDLIAKILF